MGSNTPQKFSAAKLFGFGGGDNKKVSDPAPPPPPQPSVETPNNFSNSFSTQAIKMETRFDSFKGLPSSSAGQKNYDDEPVHGAGHNWNVTSQDVDDVEVFSDSDDGEQFNNNNRNSNVLGFHDNF